MNLINKIFIVTVLALVSCRKEQPQNVTITEENILQKSQVSKNKTPQNTVNETQVLRKLNRDIIHLLKTKNYSSLQRYIHPEKGVRFSMYAFVSPQDKLFSAQEYHKYVESPVKFTWGTTDGEGKPVVLSLPAYLETWVFKRDFSQAEVFINEFKGSGNSLNNLKEKYSDSRFTENYIHGTEQYSGMDWNALRLVFEKFEGRYFLVAVINDQWTI